MQRKFGLLILICAAVGGGFLFLQKYEILNLDKITVKKRDPDSKDPHAVGNGTVRVDAPPVTRSGDTIKIATFNIQVFGTSKSKKDDVMQVLADVVRRFDVVAIQEIRSKDTSIIPNFVNLINSNGAKYDFVIGPRLGRTVSKEQYAYIFDTASIEVDRTKVYTAPAHPDRVHRAPLVSLFRVRGPPVDQAFTFKLINIHTDPDETKIELNELDDVFVKVRDDGHNEDDIILLGDLNVDDRHLGELGKLLDIMPVIVGTPTNTRGNKQYDNIIFQKTATKEFTGRYGIFNLMKEYNLTIDQAIRVSDHLPVWAEFSIYEGGQPSRVASGNQPVKK